MIILIAGGKHGQGVMSRSPLMRPGTRRPHAGADAPDTLPRSLNGLLTVDGTTGRLAPSRSRCAVHQAWCTSQGSWRSRTGARRSRSGCSRSGCDTPKGHRKRNDYFDLLEKFACPFHHAGVVSVAGGGSSGIDHGLPKPIRRRRPPFLLRVDARASAVRSSALVGRERAPMTQATSSSLYHLQSWQHEAEAVHKRQGSHLIHHRLGAA